MSSRSICPGFSHPDVTLWTAWDGDDLLAMGALKQLDAEHGEIKSMRHRARCTSARGSARRCSIT